MDYLPLRQTCCGEKPVKQPSDEGDYLRAVFASDSSIKVVCGLEVSYEPCEA